MTDRPRAILMREGRRRILVERLYRLTEPFGDYSWVKVWRLEGEAVPSNMWWTDGCTESGRHEVSLGAMLAGKTPEETLAKLGYVEVMP